MARIALLLGPDFEDSEYTVPRRRLEEAGHEIVVIGVEQGATVEGKRGEASVRIDAAASESDPGRFDALVIPGGYSPEKLRTDADVIAFVETFWGTGRPVAAVCRGPQLLIEADVVRGKEVTSWPSVRRDLESAGARWRDAEVVQDGPLITSRKPDDLEAFSDAVLGALQGARSGA